MRRVAITGLILVLCGGCTLREVRSKHKLGVEYRHSGKTSTDAQRYTVQQGFEFKWDGGLSTGLTYRRRDTGDGAGNRDDGVWFELSYPIWKAKSDSEAVHQRIARLEARLAALEQHPPAGDSARE